MHICYLLHVALFVMSSNGQNVIKPLETVLSKVYDMLRSKVSVSRFVSSMELFVKRMHEIMALSHFIAIVNVGCLFLIFLC